MKNKKVILTLLIVIVFIISGCSSETEIDNNFIEDIITLNFLPHGMKLLKDSSLTGGTFIPIVGYLINLIVSAVINIVDFGLWFIYWIPGVHEVMNFVIKSPDIDLYLMRNYNSSIFMHRSIFTHTALNPLFLLPMLICRCRKTGEIGSFMGMVFGLGFAGHLLADTMPNAWKLYSNIHLFSFAFPGMISQLWLWVNAIVALYLVFGGSEAE